MQPISDEVAAQDRRVSRSEALAGLRAGVEEVLDVGPGAPPRLANIGGAEGGEIFFH